MQDRLIRIDDYSKLQELHDKIINLISSYDVTYYNAIGILETIKQEIFTNESEGA